LGFFRFISIYTQMMKTKILGFDCSSSTIGWSVLQVDGYSINFLSCGYIKPPKKGNIVERIAQTRNEVQKLIEKVKPDHIAIEEIIQFMAGKSTAKTIIMLTTFNRMISLVAYDYLKFPPTFHNVMSIRHGLKVNGIVPKKEDMPNLVAQHLNITFPWEYNKKGKIKPENYDRADGIAVNLYYAFILTGKITSKIKKPKKKKVKVK
jgi:Holliday junction resolvasome RuvABC endonuclease subunit